MLQAQNEYGWGLPSCRAGSISILVGVLQGRCEESGQDKTDDSAGVFASDGTRLWYNVANGQPVTAGIRTIVVIVSTTGLKPIKIAV